MDRVDIGYYLVVVGYLERSVSILKYFVVAFFWSASFTKFGLQIKHLHLDHLRFMDSVDIGDYLVVGYLERLVLTLGYFFNCIFWFVNCKDWSGDIVHILFQILLLLCRVLVLEII